MIEEGRTPEEAIAAIEGAQGERLNDPVSVEVERIVSENPDMTLTIGKDANGEPVTVSARQWLDEANADLQRATDDIRLFDEAANCMIGVA
jgi:hypothetical protein